MANYIDGNERSFAAGEALEAYRRVKLSGTTVVYADAADEDGIGVTTRRAASGEQVAVRLITANGTTRMTVSGAVAAGALLYAVNDGKVDDEGTVPVARALEAGSGDNSVIEVIANPYTVIEAAE